MPFELSNSGSSFGCLMEISGGPSVVIFLYLDEICVFITNVDEIMDQIEMVFQWLKNSNFRIKLKKCHFFQCSIIFMGYGLSAGGISMDPEKVDEVQKLASSKF